MSQPTTQRSLRFTFRRAARKDAEALAEIERLTFPDAIYAGAIFKAEDFADHARNPNSRLIVAVDKETRKLAGYTLLSFNNDDTPKDTALLWGIAVHPDTQGHGLGRKLMERSEKTALHLGFNAVVLQVHVDNAPAIQLYSRMGYETQRRIENYYRKIDTALEMKKRLA